MMTGTVTAEREIMVPLEMVASGKPPTVSEVVVDTGFNGYVTLPSKVLRSLGGVSVGTRRAELGDGKIVDLEVYLVTVYWCGHEREVLALHAEAIPLIGMSLLWGSRVTFDAQANGTVTIDSIT